MADFHWTPKAVERLRQIIDEGHSSNAAVRILSTEFDYPVTRNAIMGKAARLGLHFKSAAPKVRSQESTVPSQLPKLPKIAMLNPAAPRVPPEKAAASPALTPIASALGELAEAAIVAIPTTRRVALLDLRDLMCRWPIGDPRSGDFGFCGAKAPGDGPYCGHHAQVAYEPAQERRRAREQAKRARAA